MCVDKPLYFSHTKQKLTTALIFTHYISCHTWVKPSEIFFSLLLLLSWLWTLIASFTNVLSSSLSFWIGYQRNTYSTTIMRFVCFNLFLNNFIRCPTFLVSWKPLNNHFPFSFFTHWLFYIKLYQIICYLKIQPE